MGSKAPSYITHNRFGIFIFQYRFPLRVRQQNSKIPILFRRSLRTRSKRNAEKEAKRWWFLMDELTLRIQTERTTERNPPTTDPNLDVLQQILETLKKQQTAHLPIQQTIGEDQTLPVLAERYLAYKRPNITIGTYTSLCFLSISLLPEMDLMLVDD